MRKSISAPLPAITLDSRPIYIVDGCMYDSYDEAIRHVLRSRIKELYNETEMRDCPSAYDIGGWVCDNLDRIIALRDEVRTITATKKEPINA